MGDFFWSVLTSTVVSSAAVWFLRSWISTQLEASIRNKYEIARIQFESDLKREADAGLERLRSGLSIEAARQTAELLRVHEKRMHVLSTMQGLLWKVRKTVGAYAAPMDSGLPPLSDRRKSAAKALDELDEFFAFHRCFIPKPTCDRIANARTACRNLVFEFMDNVEAIQTGEPTREDRCESRRTQAAVAHVCMNDIPPILDALDDDFREILGIVDPPNRKDKASMCP